MKDTSFSYQMMYNLITINYNIVCIWGKNLYFWSFLANFDQKTLILHGNFSKKIRFWYKMFTNVLNVLWWAKKSIITFFSDRQIFIYDLLKMLCQPKVPIFDSFCHFWPKIAIFSEFHYLFVVRHFLLWMSWVIFQSSFIFDWF